MNFDSEFEINESEPNIISSNSFYKIKKFHFSKINKKDSTSNNNINKEEIKMFLIIINTKKTLEENVKEINP